MVNRLKDHEPETIMAQEQALGWIEMCEDVSHPVHLEKDRKIKELIDWFVYMARSIVESAWSESQAIERSWNLTVNFVREYNQIAND